MKKLTLCLLLLFLLTGNSLAETTIKTEVDRLNLTTDEALTYKIILASSEKTLQQPVIPKFEGFAILSTAQSSTMSFSKINLKTTVIYAFVLQPRKTGKLQIPPASVKIKDKVYSSEGFEIEVTQGKAQEPKITIPESQEPQVSL
jgi:hypothetical protein